MNKFYFDSNIFRLIKKSHNNYNFELEDALNNIKDKTFIYYSDAHLRDLQNSNNIEFIKEDLRLMEQYVNQNYFSYCPTTKKLNIYIESPEKIYFELYNNKKQDSFDDIINELENSPFNNLLNQNISFPKILTGDNKADEFLQRFVPSGKTFSIVEFIKYSLTHTEDLLYSSKGFKELKMFVTSYMNTEKFSFKNWGDEFENKFNSTFSNNSDFSLQYIIDFTNKHFKLENDFYSQFINYYTLLEILGITNEKINNKKNRSFDSILIDAEHAFHAKESDFLITDDKGLQLKAYLCYKKFKIKTEILNIDEFVNLSKIIEIQNLDFANFINLLSYDFSQKKDILCKIENDNNNCFINTSISYFNFFDCI